jgi:hypothetical protein
MFPKVLWIFLAALQISNAVYLKKDRADESKLYHEFSEAVSHSIAKVWPYPGQKSKELAALQSALTKSIFPLYFEKVKASEKDRNVVSQIDPEWEWKVIKSSLPIISDSLGTLITES